MFNISIICSSLKIACCWELYTLLIKTVGPGISLDILFLFFPTMFTSPPLTLSLTLASSGNSPVLCGETADGSDHCHSSGLREIQRWRLQVRFHNNNLPTVLHSMGVSLSRGFLCSDLFQPNFSQKSFQAIIAEQHWLNLPSEYTEFISIMSNHFQRI